MHSSSHNNSQKQFFFTLINDEMSFCTFFTIPRNIYTARRWIVFLQFRYRCNITEMRIDTFANSENIYPMNNKFKGKCTNGISGDLHQPLQWQCIHTCNERLKFGLLSGVLIEIDSLFSSLGELLWKLSVQKCPSVQVLIRISIMHEFVNIVNTSGPFYDRDRKPLPLLASIPWGNTRRCWPRSWWRSAGGWGWTWCAPPGWGSASAARISDIRS